MYSVARVIVPDLGSFACALPADLPLAAGDRCVFELEHVHELGTIGTVAAQEAPPTADRGTGVVLRKLTEDDVARDATNQEVAAKALAAFRDYLAKDRVPARAMKARFSLRRERLALWYASDDPFDLRQIVGHLQRQFATKVDARQVGVRDEAAMLGGCGSCGRPLCCATWLRCFHTVNIRMARTQELSLTPSAVNGMCGRLKCCLRYEHEQYAEAEVGMPPVGVIVSWPDGEGVVVSRDVLARKVTVRSDNRFLTKAVAELHPSGHGADAARAPGQPDDEEERHELQTEDSDR